MNVQAASAHLTHIPDSDAQEPTAVTTYLVNHTDRNTELLRSQRVEARTPEAAARKVHGKNTSFGAERDTMDGAVRALGFTTMYGNGEVQWAKTSNVVLVRYVYREEMDPFWTDPSQWQDAGNPLTILSGQG